MRLGFEEECRPSETLESLEGRKATVCDAESPMSVLQLTHELELEEDGPRRGTEKILRRRSGSPAVHEDSLVPMEGRPILHLRTSISRYFMEDTRGLADFGTSRSEKSPWRYV